MEIRNITEIKPNPANPRIIKDDRFKKLVKSLAEFPDMLNKRPLVCVTDTDGLIFPLGGNMRLLAAKAERQSQAQEVLQAAQRASSLQEGFDSTSALKLNTNAI